MGLANVRKLTIKLSSGPPCWTRSSKAQWYSTSPSSYIMCLISICIVLGCLWVIAVVVLVNVNLAMDIALDILHWVTHVVVRGSVIATFLGQITMDSLSLSDDLLSCPYHNCSCYWHHASQTLAFFDQYREYKYTFSPTSLLTRTFIPNCVHHHFWLMLLQKLRYLLWFILMN
jgi:hypothetical protein